METLIIVVVVLFMTGSHSIHVITIVWTRDRGIHRSFFGSIRCVVVVVVVVVDVVLVVRAV